MSHFLIKKASVAGEPSRPPASARPVVEGSPPIVRHPQSTFVDGQGYPAGQYGYPEVVLGTPRTDDAGLTFWNSMYTNSTVAYELVKTRLFDPYTDSWKLYSGVLWRYTIGETAASGTHPYVNFRARVTKLVEIVSWD